MRRAAHRARPGCGRPWPYVFASRSGRSERFVPLARDTCAPDLSLVLDVGQAEWMKFPDNSLFHRRFSTVCVARDRRPALFLTSKRGGDALLSKRCGAVPGWAVAID